MRSLQGNAAAVWWGWLCPAGQGQTWDVKYNNMIDKTWSLLSNSSLRELWWSRGTIAIMANDEWTSIIDTCISIDRIWIKRMFLFLFIYLSFAPKLFLVNYGIILAKKNWALEFFWSNIFCTMISFSKFYPHSTELPLKQMYFCQGDNCY